MNGEPLTVLLLAFFGIMSLLAFVLYGVDKGLAKGRMWRIPEATLLSLSFFGGAVGALCGMLLFRHKTLHISFWAVTLLGLLWQGAVLFLWIL
jgi:uncharacterized membrane protein YsdA (DUF1294 family)